MVNFPLFEVIGPRKQGHDDGEAFNSPPFPDSPDIWRDGFPALNRRIGNLLSWYIVAVAGARDPPSTPDLFVIDKTQVCFANSSSSDTQILAFVFPGFAMRYDVLAPRETGMTWLCAKKSLALVSGPAIDHLLDRTALFRSHSPEAHKARTGLPPLHPFFETRRIRQAYFH